MGAGVNWEVSPQEPIVITFLGVVPGKKNRKAPCANGRGLFLEKNTRLALERLELQVPSHVRGLALEHPDLEIHITYDDAHRDRDGILTTILDILQKYRVIQNDNIAHFNGNVTIPPAVRGDMIETKVVLWPRGGAAVAPSVRYVKPRKLSRRINAPAAAGLEDFHEDE